MARIKLAYIGGGSTRAPGTMASLVSQGENFDGSEVVLIDLDLDRLDLVQTLATKLARAGGIDLTVHATTDRRAGLEDCDAVLTSFRPGGFEARHLDECIPLKHNIIGQETQGPGGFFMALRSIFTMSAIIGDMADMCPSAFLFNYTNPINIVSQAVTCHTAVQTVSLCEGPIIFPRMVARAAGLDPARVDAVMIGLNHGSWTVRHLYDGEDMIPHVRDGLRRRRDDPALSAQDRRLLEISCMMDSLPAAYFQYYYFRDEILAELQQKPTTRAQDIMKRTDAFWTHYREQVASESPTLDPDRSRGGINELELAVDVMDAVFNDRGETWPVNVPNTGSIPGFPDDLVVEVPGYVDRSGVRPIGHGSLPPAVRGLVSMLAEYQMLTAKAAWHGTRRDAVRALAANPLVLSLTKAEALYEDLSSAHRDYLPDRLLY